jgi:hypothetical protein
LVDPVAFFEVELEQGCRPAGGLNLVIKRFECTERPGRDYNVRACLGEAQCDGSTDAA